MRSPSEPLTWDDLPGLRVGLLGLGREGEASLRACRARGIEPVLVDDNPRDGVLGTADGGLDALLGCDVVVKTPGISAYAESVTTLRDAGVRIAGGLGLWLAGADRSRVLCVTGTKGKSTTSAIAGHLIRGLGHSVLVGGNIGVPPFDPRVDADVDWWVVEVSSYQALDVHVTPPVVAVTSLHPDHLPWHGGDPETYYRDKLSLCTHPGASVTVANGDDALVRSHASQLGPRVRWVGTGALESQNEPWLDTLGLRGAHNRRNGLIAAAALAEMGVPGADDPARLAAAAPGFAGLESRLQVVGEADGVLFVDDGLSTNVLPTLAAVEAFPDRPVALIVGGQDRGIDYAELGDGLRGNASVRVFTIPDNGPRIHASLGAGVDAVDCPSLPAAVRDAYEWARPGGVVLLSPAAPSFGHYADYRARGAAFAAAMRGCVSAGA